MNKFPIFFSATCSPTLPLINAEAKQLDLEKSEVTHHKKTGRDEYHNDGRNTNNIEVVYFFVHDLY